MRFQTSPKPSQEKITQLCPPNRPQGRISPPKWSDLAPKGSSPFFVYLRITMLFLLSLSFKLSKLPSWFSTLFPLQAPIHCVYFPMCEWTHQFTKSHSFSRLGQLLMWDRLGYFPSRPTKRFVRRLTNPPIYLTESSSWMCAPLKWVELTCLSAPPMPYPIFLCWWSTQFFPSTFHQIVSCLTCVIRHLGWIFPLVHHTPKKPQLSPIWRFLSPHSHQASFVLHFLCFGLWWKCVCPRLASEAL